MSSRYEDLSLKGDMRGKCRPFQCTIPGSTSKQALCNPVLFCDESGNPICAVRNQDVAKTCWEKTQQRANQTECKAKIPEAVWDQIDTGMRKFCQRDGANVLFCFECSTMAEMVHKKNLEAQASIGNKFERENSDGAPATTR